MCPSSSGIWELHITGAFCWCDNIIINFRNLPPMDKRCKQKNNDIVSLQNTISVICITDFFVLSISINRHILLDNFNSWFFSFLPFMSISCQTRGMGNIKVLISVFFISIPQQKRLFSSLYVYHNIASS